MSSDSTNKIRFSDSVEQGVDDVGRIFNSMRLPILHFNSHGRVIRANDQAITFFPSDSFIDREFWEFAGFWSEPRLRHREICDIIRRGEPVWQALESAVVDDEKRWYHVDKIPLRSTEGPVTGLALVISDVSEYISSENALRESDARYKAFIANSADAIWRYDICPPIDVQLPIEKQVELILRRAVLIECNHKLLELFGAQSSDDVLGLPLHRNGSLTNKRDLSTFIKNGYRAEEMDSERLSLGGKRVQIQHSAIGIVEKGFLTRAWGTSKDVTTQKSYLDRMKYLASHDVLTGLPNRALLYKKMEEAFKSRKNQKMALLLIDLDKFKEINDTLGHVTGDVVLKQLGPRLQAELEEIPSVIARLGGDEFAIFLSHIRNFQQAVVVGHRCLDAICEPFELEGYHTEINASVGISIYPDQAKDVSTMMRFADVAMYHAKNNLKGVALYDAEYDPHSPVRLEIMGALGKAIRQNQLNLYFQPKVCLKTNRVFSFEALLRWYHPEHGWVPPSVFIPIAEASNMIFPLTVWVLNETIKQCAEWSMHGKDFSIAMNLSPRNLADERIVDEIRSALYRYNVDGQSLEMEITESCIFGDSGRAQVILDRISEMGVRLSVDDYGTGYSSLAYLKKLPVQTLKIDMSFIRNMMNDEQDSIIVNSTIQLAHNLGLKVVAEGIESEDVVARLAEWGCDAGQGYLFARPMAVSDVNEWLAETTFC